MSAPDWTTAITDGFLTGFHCHQSGLLSGGTENVCQTTKYPKCGTQSACRVQTKSVSGTWETLRAGTLGSTNVEGGLHSPFLVKIKLDRVTKNPSAYGQDAVEPVQNLWASSADLSWFPKQHSRWRPILDLNKQPRTYQISCPGSDIPVQSTVFRSVHCTHGAHCSSKGVETDGHTQGYNNPPVLRRLVGKATSHQVCLQHKSKLEPNAGLRPCRLPVRPHGRSGLTYTGPLAEPSGQTLEILSLPVCSVHQFMFTNSHRKASSPRSTS